MSLMMLMLSIHRPPILKNTVQANLGITQEGEHGFSGVQGLGIGRAIEAFNQSHYVLYCFHSYFTILFLINITKPKKNKSTTMKRSLNNNNHHHKK